MSFFSWFVCCCASFRACYYNPNGAGVLSGQVNTFSDLPHPEDASPPSAGDLYKVVGYDEDNFGGYYVRYSGSVWNETYGPGANTAFDEATMPHALIRESDGTFTRIGDSTVPSRSYHLCHRHQVPEMGGTFSRDRSRERRKGQPEETRA